MSQRPFSSHYLLYTGRREGKERKGKEVRMLRGLGDWEMYHCLASESQG